jgi:hypothetical protein
VRPAVNASTGGLGAPVVSTLEDVGAGAMSVVAVAAPMFVLVLLVVGGYLVWRLWKRRRARATSP